MNSVFDTIIWLVNFPAQHGYAMVFIAAFASFGLLRMAFGGGAGSAEARMAALREQAGLATTPPNPARRAAAVAQRWFYRMLGIVVISGGVIGVLSLTGLDITEGYIAEYGVTTVGEYDDDFVTFTTRDGTEYTQPVDFFTPAIAPGGDSWISSGPVTVIYLEQHPQAFVIDTTDEPR